MKTTIWAAVLTVLGAGAAFAQEGDLRRELEKRVRELEERFRAEREKLEKEFRDKREKLMPRREDGGKPRLEELVEKLMDRVDRLERRLNEGFGEFGRALPKDFDFKKLMPRLEDRDFRFEFRRKGDEDPGDKNPKKEFFEFRKLFERHEEKKHEEREEKKKAEKKAEKKPEDEKKKKPKEEDNF